MQTLPSESLPVVGIFAYNRESHLRRTVEALKRNYDAVEYDIVVFSDGPRAADDYSKVDNVRKFCQSISGFKSVNLVAREMNFGLYKNIVSGVTELLTYRASTIILEDDLVTSPFFLRYITNGLRIYKSTSNVVSIHGYIYPIKKPLPEFFFLRGADCLGWGTWVDRWKLFEPDAKRLYSELSSKRMVKRFDLNGVLRNSSLLRRVADGKSESWAIRWHASAFLHGGVTLYPGRSLVQHIGGDGTGTNVGITDEFDVELSKTPIHVTFDASPQESISASKMIEEYFRSKYPSLARRVFQRLLMLLKIMPARNTPRR